MEAELEQLIRGKTGRNDPCICGSGKKYKKCCLNVPNNTDITEYDDCLDYIESENFVTPARASLEDSMPSMSGIILEYGDDLLITAKTKKEFENLINLVVLAWNTSYVDEDQYEEKLDALLRKMKVKPETEDWFAMRSTVDMLIKRRIADYPSMRRLIVDYKIRGKNDEWKLNVFSLDFPH